jgi:hypothetical protein
MTDANEEKRVVSEKLTTTIEVDKELFLKFKALCVLKEDKMSGVIEEMIRGWVENASTSISIDNNYKRE